MKPCNIHPDDARRAIDLTGYTFTSQVKALADGATVATLTCTALSQSITEKGG